MGWQKISWILQICFAVASVVEYIKLLPKPPYLHAKQPSESCEKSARRTTRVLKKLKEAKSEFCLYSSFCLWNTWPTMGMISRNQLWIDAKLFPWRQRSLCFQFSCHTLHDVMYSLEQIQVRTSDHKVFPACLFCDSCCLIHNISWERQHLKKFLRSNSHLFLNLTTLNIRVVLVR